MNVRISEGCKFHKINVGMEKIKKRSNSPLAKKARHGFRGYPVATIAFYGPDDSRVSKVAVTIWAAEEAEEPTAMRRWYLDEGDVRTDAVVQEEILQFVRAHEAGSISVADRIIGCPHEEAIDYPEGEACPKCPFWANRDR